MPAIHVCTIQKRGVNGTCSTRCNFSVLGAGNCKSQLGCTLIPGGGMCAICRNMWVKLIQVGWPAACHGLHALGVLVHRYCTLLYLLQCTSPEGTTVMLSRCTGVTMTQILLTRIDRVAVAILTLLLALLLALVKSCVHFQLLCI